MIQQFPKHLRISLAIIKYTLSEFEGMLLSMGLNTSHPGDTISSAKGVSIILLFLFISFDTLLGFFKNNIEPFSLVIELLNDLSNMSFISRKF